MEKQMSLEAQTAAIQGFQRAIENGETALPVALTHVLDALRADVTHIPDLNLMADGIRAEIPFAEELERGHVVNEPYPETWVQAIRGVLSNIRSWAESDDAPNREALRALFTAAFVLDAQAKGLAHVAASFTSEPLRLELAALLSDFVFQPLRPNQRQRDAHKEAEDCAEKGNYERLHSYFRELNFFPGGDILPIVTFLHVTAPETLARIIEEKNDINFSGVINDVLDSKSLRFALTVQNVGFKFVCLETVLRRHWRELPDDVDAPIGEILRQVAENSDQDWNGWMRAYLRYPGGYPTFERALALELPNLEEKHWMSVLNAPSLSHFGKYADAFAQMMIDFKSVATAEAFLKICRLAYEIWNKWDYRPRDSQSYLFSPAACAFDFPVSFYYACQPVEVTEAEAERLQSEIDGIAERWFASSSELTDERYRLMSRLRLVRHGIALQNGSSDALPPKVTVESELFYRARFPYSSINH